MGNKASSANNKEFKEYSKILKKEICGDLFQKYDKDADKKLSKSEVTQMLTDEFGLDEEQIKVASSLMDGDQNGFVDSKEFNAILRQENLCRVICDTEPCKFLSEAWRIFRKHDKDLSGNLTKAELKVLLTSLGIPTASTDEIFRKADSNKNAFVNYHEFVQWLPATAVLLKTYKQ